MERYEITTKQEKRRVGPLFDGIHHSLVKTFLQGYDGRAFCDDLAFPRCAVIQARGFVFFGGDPSCENAREFAEYPLDGGEALVIVPCDEGWLPLIEAAHPGKMRAVTRYATERRPEGFDKEQLRALMRGIPQDYTLLGMDEEIYDMAMALPWARGLCAFFNTAEEYVERGIGFCVLKDEKLAAGASSFNVYDDGIGVAVASDGKGGENLAKACAAALVLSCLAQKRTPSFDAADAGALALAKELGYALKAEYKCLAYTP